MRVVRGLMIVFVVVPMMLSAAVVPSSAADRVGAPWVVSASPTSVTLDWSAAAEDGRYRVMHARTPAAVRRTSASQRTRPATSHLRVTGLRPCTEYCFQVARANGSGRSAPYCHSTPSQVPAVGATPVRVVTFNICGHVCSDWSRRRSTVVRRILEARADVVALQETTRRGDDESLLLPLRRRGYRMVHDTQNEMILYRTATLSPVYMPGQLPWGTVVPRPGTSAAWTSFEHQASGKIFTVVSTHLTAGRSAATERLRRKEARSLLTLMGRTRAVGPVIYAGDVNSSRARRGDGVGRDFARAGYADAYQQSVSHTLAWVSSSNGFESRPRRSPRYGDHIDRIFAPSGFGVSDWEVVAPLRGGRNVRPLASDHHPVAATVWLP